MIVPQKKDDQMLTVGYWDQNYPEKRNIVYSGERATQVNYVPVSRKKNALISRYISKNLPGSDVVNNIRDFYYHSLRKLPFDLIHCYNGTCAVPGIHRQPM